jgi:hypothetical protein
MNKRARFEVGQSVEICNVAYSRPALGRPMDRILASHLVTFHTFHPIVLVSFGEAGHELDLPHSVQLTSSRISRGEFSYLYSWCEDSGLLK